MKTRHGRGLYAPELLEARIAPATFLVTTLADSGPGSLRQAVLDANGAAGADSITFDKALSGKIDLTSARIDITEAVTIKGPGVDVITVSGLDARQIFRIDYAVASLVPTAISGLSIIDGRNAGPGGAIFSVESLSLSRVVITQSEADYGGGLSAIGREGKALTILNSVITGNTGTEVGGGLYAKVAKALIGKSTSWRRHRDLRRRSRRSRAASADRRRFVPSLTIKTTGATRSPGLLGKVPRTTLSRRLPTRGARYLLDGMKTCHHRGLYSPELLESRIAPATIIVTSLADDGTGGITLREAIVQANDQGSNPGADTITFDPAILPGVITLMGAAEIAITDTLTIKGPGVDKLTISGANASRIFNIDDGDTAVLHPTTISGITFLGGNVVGADGGAIRSTESLTLSKVVISSSIVSGGGSKGGGVFVNTAGKVRIDNSHFIDNTANSGGGGVYATAEGGITVTKSLLSGNTAGSAGGGLRLHSNAASARILVDGCTFIGNSANDGGGAFIDRAGTGTATVKNSTFTGNTASDDGGGLYLNQGTITVERSTFSRNTAGTAGGAIADNFIAGLVIKNSRFDGNEADRGGALYAAGAHPVTVTGSVFTANESTVATGGAIDARGGIALTVKTSTFAGNTATTDGGAIALENAGTSLLLASSTVSGNAGVNGGGVSAGTGAKLTVTGGAFSGNIASGSGGGLHTTGTGADAVALSVTGTLFLGNRATTDNVSDGGGVFAVGDGTILIKSVRAIGNQAADDGGGMFLRSTVSVSVQGSLFQQNVAAEHAGGLSFNLTAAAAVGTITGSKFLDNFGGRGGGIEIFGDAAAALTIKSSTITGNVASVEGGGLRKDASSPTLTLIATVITGNWAPTGPNIFP